MSDINDFDDYLASNFLFDDELELIGIHKKRNENCLGEEILMGLLSICFTCD